MPTLTGSFNNSGIPVFRFHLCGAFPGVPETVREFEALVDTGFSGFVALPLIKAFPLALPLHSTTTVVLADGSQQYRLMAAGSAILGEETQTGLIILEPNSTEVLIGMGFLRAFKKKLIVCPETDTVSLEDADENIPSEPPEQQSSDSN
jgi:predicted aspartyl protease